MKKTSKWRPVAVFTIFILIMSSLSNSAPVTVSASQKAAKNTTWDTDQVLGYQGSFNFAGVYEFDNLTIGDNVTVYSSGISQLVIKVNGTLTLGKNACIRVRNGYYSQAPENEIEYLTAKDLNSYGNEGGGFRAYDSMFGRGGNGGNGEDGLDTRYATSGGGGGGGGFGGGIGGVGGAGGVGSEYMGAKGQDGASNGSYGGAAGIGGYASDGGGATGIGAKGDSGKSGGNSGSGGGGNGGDGGKGCRDDYVEAGGDGGGGGGYGGGILTIIANKIIYNEVSPPKFIVSGQEGGKSSGKDGKNGEGGLLIIKSAAYKYSINHWNLGTDRYGESTVPSSNGGHGVVTGNPQKVFINGVEIVKGNENVNVKDVVKIDLPTAITNATKLLNSVTVGKNEGNVSQAAKNAYSNAIKKAKKVRDGKYSKSQITTAIENLAAATEIFNTSIMKATEMELGDYVKFGSYMGRPIQWRIINLDNDGSPLLFSEEIISIKAFDASESYGSYGSNRWSNSNLREWLNGSESIVTYSTEAPRSDKVYMNFNSYAFEAGFLYNFTIEERDLVKEINHKTILMEDYAGEKSGGSEIFLWQGSSIVDFSSNYNQAYYEDVTDKVFLLDINELYDYVYKRGYIYTRVPSQGVINNCKYYDIEGINYWLRSPSSFDSESEGCVKQNGDIIMTYAYIGYDSAINNGGGVVPALYLNTNTFVSGSGTEKDPYIVTK